MIPADKRSPGRNLLIKRLLDKWDRPMTMPQMHKRTGLSEPTIWRYVKRLLAADPREAHIAAWVQSKTGVPRFVPKYKRGPGEDAPKPESKTDAQRSRAYQDRKRADGSWEDSLAKERARHWRNRPAQRDTTVAALFGPAA